MDKPTSELKTLPSTLKYAFLDEEKAKPVIISSKLDIKHKEKLLEVLRRNEEAIGWTLTGLKGLDPSLCTHRSHAVKTRQGSPKMTQPKGMGSHERRNS